MGTLVVRSMLALVTLCIISGLVSTATAQEYMSDPNTALLTHMNESAGSNVADASGNGNDGTATGTTIVDGRFGKARSFNGTTDLVRIPTAPNLNISPFLTLEAWVKPTSFPPGSNTIIRKNGPDSQNGYLFNIHMNGTRLNFAVNTSILIGTNFPVEPSYFLDGKWHHVAGTYDGDTARVYVDGILIGKQVFGVTIGTNSTDPVCIGANDVYAEYFHGSIDEARISNKVRVPDEFNLQLAPKNLAASVQGITVNLSWVDGGGGATLLHYRIYRGADSTNVSLIDSTSSASYIDREVQAGVTYFYRVSAVDVTGFESARSHARMAVAYILLPGEYISDANTMLLLHMNETSGTLVADASGYGNDGTATGTTIANGKYGKARTFAGSGNFITIQDSPSLRPSQVTVESWVYSADYKAMPWGIIASKERTSGSFSYRLQMAASSGRIYFATGIDQNNGVTSVTPLEDGRWYHVAGTFDATTLRVYIDGVLEASKIQPGSIPYNADVLYLGRDIDNVGVWKGILDEVRISDVARTPPFDVSPYIVSVRDVPNDQGGSVTIQWTASALDTNVSQLPFYSIWRSLPGGVPSSNMYQFKNDVIDRFKSASIRIITMNGTDYAWEWLGNQPAHRFPLYSYTAATLYDSMSTTDGKQYFLVSAHTSDADVFYDSNVDSGYSVDNLSPLSPRNLSASVEGGQVVLRWTANREQDLRQYLLYRSTAPGIDPNAISSFAGTIDTTYVDADPLAGDVAYYVVRAQDIHDNLSPASSEVGVTLTGILERGERIPTAYRLYQNYPNPFNPATVIQFDIPKASHVSITIYNPLGQLVARVVDGEKPAGRFRVTWDATGFTSGMYYYRLQAEDFVQTKEMILLK